MTALKLTRSQWIQIIVAIFGVFGPIIATLLANFSKEPSNQTNNFAPAQTNFGGTNTQTINLLAPLNEKKNYYKNFPVSIKEILDQNKTKTIYIFSDSSSAEAGDYACNIHQGLNGDGFNAQPWPDSFTGFGSADCYAGKQNNEYFPRELTYLESAKNKTPIKDTDGIKLLSVDADKVVLWVKN